jgi:hypothetical protein
MLTSSEHFEVFNPIVSLVAVQVMNLFVGSESPAESVLHDHSVFEYILTSGRDPIHTLRVKHKHISPGIKVTSASVIRIERLCAAGHGIAYS